MAQRPDGGVTLGDGQDRQSCVFQFFQARCDARFEDFRKTRFDGAAFGEFDHLSS
ncbi:hypothetical protein [Chelativorans sp. M5D2P16]|uniref:hypothetical protein n=1 Tax=Chelativorans sp. M5D2P16 TaxID=3095678 RepID=UPI002ACAB893|nr:hypothetical protein [Chelativorans sp. M5D2P16]MDZ5697909.1 hypothetical protein [Chelativorans sp. M5D2P16]